MEVTRNWEEKNPCCGPHDTGATNTTVQSYPCQNARQTIDRTKNILALKLLTYALQLRADKHAPATGKKNQQQRKKGTIASKSEARSPTSRIKTQHFNFAG